MEATLNFACLENDHRAIADDKGRMASNTILRAIGKGMFVAVAGAAMTFGGAVTANADGLTVQSGSSVDTDGTQGSWAPATSGSQRPLTTQSSAGHTIESDACYVKNNPVYCPPPSSFNPEVISAITGTSDDPDSKLDPDGFQDGVGR